jgi:nitroreductase
MNVVNAIQKRRSIRSFQKKSIPKKLLLKILERARWAPSWGNTQPWKLYVLTGEKLARFREENRQRLVEGSFPSPEITMPSKWPQALKGRYSELGRRLLSSISIERDDKEGRNRYYAEMFSLFDAPCLIVMCVDRSLIREYALLDVGLMSQTIALLANEEGLGSCIMAAAVSYPELIRKYMPIPKGEIIAIGMVLGFPERRAPVNSFERRRAPLEEVLVWVE